MLFYFIISLQALQDGDLIVTQELVDSINNDPSSSFKAKLYPQFAHLTKRDVQKFLSPVRKPPEFHSSPRPVGYNERKFYDADKRMFTGIEKHFGFDVDGKTLKNITYTSQYGYIEDSVGSDKSQITEMRIPVYDNTQFCSSWATAVTSAMTITLSRYSGSTVNLSLQFILDCDILGDPCVERPQISSYEQFWRRFIPDSNNWRELAPLSSPSKQLTQDICDNYRGCYPGLQLCTRQRVLTGYCDDDRATIYGVCPVYFLHNWRWIKSHLAEVGAVTSTIIVRAPLFTYEDGIYSASTTKHESPWDANDDSTQTGNDAHHRTPVLGMLDVTIIGWGQRNVNLTSDANRNTRLKQRWWYVIPHLGLDYGLPCDKLVEPIEGTSPDILDTFQTKDGVNTTFYGDKSNTERFGIQFTLIGRDQTLKCRTDNYTNQEFRTGIIKFNRRFDDSNIESQAVGAVPYNFVPKPMRTPFATHREY